MQMAIEARGLLRFPGKQFFYGNLPKNGGESSYMIVRAMADDCGVDLSMALAAKIREHHRLAQTETAEPGPEVIQQDVGASRNRHGQALTNVQERYPELTFFQSRSALEKNNTP